MQNYTFRFEVAESYNAETMREAIKKFKEDFPDAESIEIIT